MSFASGPVLATVLAKAPPNPNNVVGGWVAFAIVLGLGAAVVFLYFSLKKQLGRVNFEEAPDPRAPRGEQPQEPGAGQASADGAGPDRKADHPNGSTPS